MSHDESATSANSSRDSQPAGSPDAPNAESIVANVLGTWFGWGNSPIAPGTMGSLGAVPLHLALRWLHPGLHIAVVAGISAVGVWSAQKVADDTGMEDPQKVVIDEVAGVLIAMGMVRQRSAALQFAALVLFRFFDITKPGPIGRAEHAKPAGFGIMLDDILAGFVAGQIARRL